MTRALDAVASDCHKTLLLLRGAFDAPNSDSGTWKLVGTLCERLQEEASRALFYAKQAETMARVQAMQPHGLQE